MQFPYDPKVKRPKTGVVDEQTGFDLMLPLGEQWVGWTDSPENMAEYERLVQLRESMGLPHIEDRIRSVKVESGATTPQKPPKKPGKAPSGPARVGAFHPGRKAPERKSARTRAERVADALDTK